MLQCVDYFPIRAHLVLFYFYPNSKFVDLRVLSSKTIPFLVHYSDLPFINHDYFQVSEGAFSSGLIWYSAHARLLFFSHQTKCFDGRWLHPSLEAALGNFCVFMDSIVHCVVFTEGHFILKLLHHFREQGGAEPCTNAYEFKQDRCVPRVCRYVHPSFILTITACLISHSCICAETI